MRDRTTFPPKRSPPPNAMAAKAATHDNSQQYRMKKKVRDRFNSATKTNQLARCLMPWVAAYAAMTK